MVKNSKLAKSINDVAWSTFRQWLEYFGFKYGKATVAVAPHNTSQNCSNCGQKVAKSLSTRTHVCPHCGYVEDRDINAAINILKKGLSTVGHTETNTRRREIPSGLVGYVLPDQGNSMNQESLAFSDGSVNKSAVGTENYSQLKQTWVKANRILTAGANLIDSVRSMHHTIIEAQEIVGGWVAKIGNGLTHDGVVNDDTIDWMPERPDFKNPFFRAQQVIEELTDATESVNQLASAVIETQELTTQIATNYEAFKDEIATKGDEKKIAENTKKQDSQSSQWQL
jgi:ribosomal protein L37E/uncharacterized protein YktA (UPF0223 family)